MESRGNRDPKHKGIPQDFLVYGDILEFIADRLGMDMNFLEYTRNGTHINDNGGFIDDVIGDISRHRREIDNINQEYVQLRDEMKHSVSFKLRHEEDINRNSKNMMNMWDVIRGRNWQVADLQRLTIQQGKDLRRLRKDLDNLREKCLTTA